MNTDTGFLLVKWYLDCVTDDGRTFIGYSAEMKWKALTLHYSSSLQHTAGSASTTRTSLRKGPSPRLRDSIIDWSSPSLLLKGTWKPLASPIQEALYESPDGSILWSCLAPHAEVELELPERARLTGRGYVERLEMSLLPGKLPIDELRWGRFIAENDVLVWLDWRGANRQQYLYHNGTPVVDCSISNDEIILERDRTILNLVRREVLQEGPLLSTSLSMIPGIEKFAPLKILQAHQRKWLSRGSLMKENRRVGSGWTIHECVRFP